MEDYVRKIFKTLSDKLGKYNVVVRYNSQIEAYEICIKNQFGLVNYTYDRECFEYDFDNTIEDILKDFRYGRRLND